MSEEDDEDELAYVPPEEWVRYMAIFHRFLAATHRYFAVGDREGIWLSAIMADELHNVPAMLEHYEESFWHSPSSMDSAMRAFPDRVQNWRTSRRIIAECREIFSSDFQRNLESLGIQEEEIVLPVTPVRRILLNCLYQGCLGLRSGATRRRPFFYNPFRRWEREQRIFKAVMAKHLVPAPLLLVRWSDEGWIRFREKLLHIPPEIPPDFQFEWNHYISRTLNGRA